MGWYFKIDCGRKNRCDIHEIMSTRLTVHGFRESRQRFFSKKRIGFGGFGQCFRLFLSQQLPQRNAQANAQKRRNGFVRFNNRLFGSVGPVGQRLSQQIRGADQGNNGEKVVFFHRRLYLPLEEDKAFYESKLTMRF